MVFNKVFGVPEITKFVVDALVVERVVEVALVEVEFPVMFKFPLIVEDAVEMKPARVERLVTFSVLLIVEEAFETNPLLKYQVKLSVAVVEAV